MKEEKLHCIIMDKNMMARFWEANEIPNDNTQQPIFVPIQSPPFSRIPPTFSEEDPEDPGDMLRLQIVINRDCVIRIMTSLLVLLVLFPVMLRLKERLKSQSMLKVRKHLQIVFMILNICWIAGCVLLLFLSGHIIFVYERRAKVALIEEIFPWYVMTIVVCCIIEMIESMLGLYDPTDECQHLHRVISIHSSQSCLDFQQKVEKASEKEMLNSKNCYISI